MTTVYKFLILSLAILIIGCKAEQEMLPEEKKVEEVEQLTVTNKQFEASKMKLSQLEQKTFDKKITVNGNIHLPLKNKAIVSSMMSGSIGAFDLVVGQWVKKGQILFTVTNPELIDLQESYLVLESKLNYMKEELIRNEALVQENLTAKKDLYLIKSEFEAGQANFNSIAKKLSLYGIPVKNLTIDNLKSSIAVVAPISGYVSKIDAMRGQFISPATEVMTIDNRSHIHLEIKVLERDASFIKKGQKITFTTQGTPNKNYNAEVYLMDPNIGENGIVNVHCHIINDETNLLPGMYVSADIVLDSYEATAINEEAIVQIGGLDHILIEQSSNDNEMNFEPVLVKKGMVKNGFVELIDVDNLTNKQILIKGGYYLVN